MGAAAIIGIVLTALALILGSGFARSLWTGRRQIRVGVDHAAVDRNYVVDVEVTNAGERDEHLTAIRLTKSDGPGEGWTTSALELEMDVELTARGKPARQTFVLPPEWVERRARFRVEAKISSRERWFRSRTEEIHEGVLALLEQSSEPS